ncbi:sensor histidine kinase [Streptococcus agalactiae]|uniref:sensor histidine kinase n=1 Tax=Streptococcus agalactiae TaxID=1311 RepID=UPI003C716E55
MKINRSNWKKLKHSVIGQLALAIISVFIAMTILSNLLINLYQTHLTNQMIMNYNASIKEKSKTLVLVDTSSIESMWEFRIFSFCIVIFTIVLGSGILYIIITRIMKPFQELANNVAEVNINNLNHYQKKLSQVDDSVELTQLTTAFNQALEKIYNSYDRERQFSNDVAHELRIPLAIMRSKLDLYQKQKKVFSGEEGLFVRTMDQSIERLSNLVEGILLFSRQDKLKLAPLQLKELIEEVIFDLEDMAEQKQVVITLTGKEIDVVTDDQLLARAIFNIIENAIKYNVEGGTVRVTLKESNTTMEIAISDSGVGISDEDKNHIFDLFYRVDDSRNSSVKGYGIGLSLVGKIIKQLKGTISVENNVPHGTIITISLPK